MYVKRELLKTLAAPKLLNYIQKSNNWNKLHKR